MGVWIYGADDEMKSTISEKSKEASDFDSFKKED